MARGKQKDITKAIAQAVSEALKQPKGSGSHAVETPKLLMLSGVGPSATLGRLGVSQVIKPLSTTLHQWQNDHPRPPTSFPSSVA